MPDEFDLLTIGNAIVDVLARTNDRFLSDNGIEKGAMTLVDGARADAIYAAMGPAVEASGGSAGNTVAGLVSLGGRGAYIGKVADDALGRIFRHDIAAQGVYFETAPLAAGGPPTARSMILITPDGERSMNTHLSACLELGPEDVDAAVVRRARVTYFEGYLWDPPRAKDAIRLAARIAHEAGREVAMTLSDSFCVLRWRAEFLELLRSGTVDIAFANESEAMALFETDDLDEAVRRLAEATPLFACVTRAEKGCIVADKARRVDVPAVEIAEVVDTTGAGDLFASGFLRGYTAGLDLEASARLGAIAAARCIVQIGPRPMESLKDRPEVRALLGA